MSHDAPTLEAFARLLGIRGFRAYEPTSADVNAAAQDIPVVLSQEDYHPCPVQMPGPPPGEKVITAADLMRQLGQRGHVQTVAAWGIYRLIQRAFLGAGITKFQVLDERFERPEFFLPIPCIVTVGSQGEFRLVGAMAGQETPKMRSVDGLVVWSTRTLWEWWKHTPEVSLSCTGSEEKTEQQSVTIGSAHSSEPTSERSVTVILASRSEQPMVLGEMVPLLTPNEYFALKVLLEAHPGNVRQERIHLRASEMSDKEVEIGDPAKTLRALAKKHPRWKTVLRLPGGSRNKGYGIYKFLDEVPLPD